MSTLSVIAYEDAVKSRPKRGLETPPKASGLRGMTLHDQHFLPCEDFTVPRSGHYGYHLSLAVDDDTPCEDFPTPCSGRSHSTMAA